jgi:hypothetical protein
MRSVKPVGVLAHGTCHIIVLRVAVSKLVILQKEFVSPTATITTGSILLQATSSMA